MHGGAAAAGSAGRREGRRCREPQHPVVRAAAQPREDRPGGRPAPLGGELEQPAVEAEKPAAQAVLGGLQDSGADIGQYVLPIP